MPAETARATDTARPPMPNAPPGVTAFVDVTVIPMDRERALPHQTVLVQEGWITALGPTGRVPVPAAARRIDGRGKFLLPGLSECHGHLSLASVYTLMKQGGKASPYDTLGAEHRLFLYLANGVTTLRNLDYRAAPGMLGGGALLRLRQRAAAGELWSPWIYTSGAYSPDSAESGQHVVPESVATYVARYKAAGYDFLKVHDEPVAVVDSLAAAARREGLALVGHAIGGLEHDFALGAYKSIEHLTGYLDTMWALTGRGDTANLIAELAAATQRAGVWNCPTLVNRGLGNGPDPSDVLKYRLVKALQDAGAGLLLGTDVPVVYRHDKFDRAIPSDERRLQALADEGAIHEELVEFVRAGLTPYQALVAGTRNMAAYLGTLDVAGTVAVGKRADLVLLSGNPLQEIRRTERPAGVMIGGRWLPREELNRRIAAIEASYVGPSSP